MFKVGKAKNRKLKFFTFHIFIESKKTAAKQNTRKQSNVTMWNINENRGAFLDLAEIGGNM